MSSYFFNLVHFLIWCDKNKNKLKKDIVDVIEKNEVNIMEKELILENRDWNCEGITISRRDFVKSVSAGAIFLTLPNLAIDLVGPANKKSDFVDSDPLVVVVKNNELVGFKGFEKFKVKDDKLVADLHKDESISDYIKKDPIVLLIEDDRFTKFRGLKEFTIKDNDMTKRLSSKFSTRIGG